jgi:DNA-binding PadR family transcriptional regulator
MTAGWLQMGAGTLYGALKNLLSSGLIHEVESNSERRRNYQITSFGKELVEREIARYEEMIKNGRNAIES